MVIVKGPPVVEEVKNMNGRGPASKEAERSHASNIGTSEHCHEQQVYENLSSTTALEECHPGGVSPWRTVSQEECLLEHSLLTFS